MLFEENCEIVQKYFIKLSQLSNQNNLINIYTSNSKSSSLVESGNMGINDYEKMKNDKSKKQESNKSDQKISMIKKSFLDNENERQFDNNKKSNNSNKNITNVYKRKYSFLDTSSAQNSKKYTNTPNRYFPSNDKSNDNIEIKKRPFSPNITFKETYNKQYNPFNKKYINSNYMQSDRKGERDLEKILANNLKDLDKQINLMYRGNNFSENKNKNNYFNKNNFLAQPFGGSQYNNFNYHENKNSRKINIQPYYNGKYNNSFIFNNNNRFSVPHSEEKNNKYMNNFDNISKYNNNNNLTINPLVDLSSSNNNDVNRRIENLEKYVIDIKKDISSMASILSNLSKNNIIHNNIRAQDQFREETNENFNEKINYEENNKDNNKYRESTNNNNNNNDNHSMYSEFLNEENRKKNMNEFHKKYEIEINKKIDQKLQNLGEEIKNQIYDKFILPSIEQIENAMKQNIDEINDRLNEINYNNALNNISNNTFKSNKLFHSQSSLDLDYRRNSKTKNEKYKEINRLSEKLFQKLNQKEQKIKLLKEETSKYLKQK